MKTRHLEIILASMQDPGAAEIEQGVMDAIQTASRRPVEPTLDSELVANLGFDSLQVLDVIAGIEGRFDIVVARRRARAIRRSTPVSSNEPCRQPVLVLRQTGRRSPVNGDVGFHRQHQSRDAARFPLQDAHRLNQCLFGFSFREPSPPVGGSAASSAATEGARCASAGLEPPDRGA